MNDDELTTIWVGAFRYYCGRMTYAVKDFCDMLIANWDQLPVRTRKVIERDLEQAIKNNESLGHDIDREQWMRVRELWTIKVEMSSPKMYTNPNTYDIITKNLIDNIQNEKS